MNPIGMQQKAWTQRPHGLLFAIISLVGVYVLTLLLGTGYSQILYFAIALAMAIAGEPFARRTKTPLRIHVIVLIFTLLPTALICFQSAHPGADVLFQKAFGIATPSGVSKFHGRLQWFDGQTSVMRFHADAAVISSILASKPFALDDQMKFHRAEGAESGELIRAFFLTSEFADSQWIKTVSFNEAQFWKWENFNKPTGGFESIHILINENGDMWVMHIWS